MQQPTATATVLPKQLGGAKFQQSLLEWSKQSFSVFNTIFLILFVMFAAYSNHLPPTFLYQMSSSLGRLLVIVLLVILYESAGWIPALLFTIGVSIAWYNRPLSQPTHFTTEGFEGGVKTSVNQSGFRWFVERVLKEHPEAVQEDRISIGDVQDDSVQGNVRTSK